MKFTHSGNYNSGQVTTIDNGVKKEYISYGAKCNFVVKKPDEHDVDTSNKLHVKWLLTAIPTNSVGSLQFETHETFHLSEVDVDPSEEDLIYVITSTYEYLKKAFYEKAGGSKLLENSLLQMSTIQKLVQELSQALLVQPE